MNMELPPQYEMLMSTDSILVVRLPHHCRDTISLMHICLHCRHRRVSVYLPPPSPLWLSCSHKTNMKSKF
ncbi:hypothetical protein Bca4012_046555 [Brassica carinata]